MKKTNIGQTPLTKTNLTTDKPTDTLAKHQIGKNLADDQSVGLAPGKTPKQTTNTKLTNKKTTKRQWLWEFSKRIVITVTIGFFTVLIYTMIFLIFNPDSTSINGVFTDVARIFEITVVAYAVKAGFENVTKIKKYNKEDSEDEVDY